MKRIALPMAARRTRRSLEVNAPSLNAGCPNRFVVAIPTPSPVASNAALKRAMMRSRSAGEASSGIRSSSCSETPQAPNSASLCTESTGSIGSRVGPPNGSRPGLPTVHNPKVKRWRERGCGSSAAVRGSSMIDTVGPPALIRLLVELIPGCQTRQGFCLRPRENRCLFVRLSYNRLRGGREVHVSGIGRLFGPARRDHLRARVEPHALGAVDAVVAEQRVLPAAERVEGERHRDRDVDADHPDLDAALEVARGLPARGEDRDAVRVVVRVDQIDRLV